MNNKPYISFNGPAILAAAFREMDPVLRKNLYEKLEVESPVLVKAIQTLEFTYFDIDRLEDTSIQIALREVPEKDWILAWKLSSKSVQDALLRNMTKRRQADFLEQINSLPRQNKRQVVRTQMKIAYTLQGLLEKGRLKLKSRRKTLPKAS